MAKELRTLGWDYLMFVLFIAVTVLTPLWKRLFGKKKERSKADHIFATGGVSLIAIMLSIARGTLGVRTVLGYPSELFYRGSSMWEIIYGMACAYPIVCFVFVPVYFNLGITSVYQYLDLRFKSRLVRCLASATYMVRQICSLAVTVYTPTVALATVIGIPYWASIIGMSTICIFFSIMGGLKAAINADVIQTMTVIVVSVTVIVVGTITSGGPKNVYELNRDNGRLSFLNFTGDMTVRVDTTSAWLGQLFMSLSQFGCQQNFMQRYMSLKSLNDVKKAMMSNIPVIFVFFSLSWLTGMVIYSTYVNCDPFEEGYIKKIDEILPFFVEDQLSIIPGFLGIFMAMLFNGALCMMVSNLNSLSTVCCEDFLSLLPQFKGLGDKQQLGIIKITTVIFGIIIMGVAFGVGLLSGVIESSMLAFSATSGPLLGCFILAILVPFANWKGTSTGMISACALVLWIIFGGMTVDKSEINRLLPTSTEGCANFNFSQIHKPSEEISWLLMQAPHHSAYTMANDSISSTILRLPIIASTTASTTTSTTTDLPSRLIVDERSPLQSFYSISYMYYSLIGTACTVLVGMIVSYFTQDASDVYDAKLLHPLIYKWRQRFSESKPYYNKEVDSDLTTTTTNGAATATSTMTSTATTTTASATTNDNSNDGKHNHAFDAQNESNLIIGNEVEANKNHDTNKLNNTMQVMFTPASTATPTAMPIISDRHVDIIVGSDGKIGTYRKIKESRDMV